MDQTNRGTESCTTRRRLLRTAVGVSTTAVFAGCSGLGGILSDDQPNSTDGETTSGGGTAAANGGTTDGSGETQATFDCENPTIEETITSDTTFGSGCTYTLADEIGIAEGARVTVEPGARFEATGGSELSVTDGSIVARGTEDEPIVFSGSEAEPGHWNGLRIFSEADNELEHVRISHGGGSTFFKANLSVGGGGSDPGPPGRVAVRNCEFAESAGAGVRATTEATLEAFENNRIANNEGEALGFHPQNIGSLDGSSTFENNASPYVGLRWSSTAQTVEADATWPNLGIPYRFVGANVDFIDIAGTVEVQPGAVLESTSGHGLRVTSGTLVATSDSDPIVFRGVEDGPGNWDGIRVGSDADNEFDNVRVSDGGGSTFGKANVKIDGRATVSNSRLTDSAGWGLLVGEDGDLTAENNTFENNAEGEIGRAE